MFLLAVAFLRGEPAYMRGHILIGIARCIAMVLVWNELAEGDTAYVAGLVALNSVFQVFFYGLYAGVFHTVLPRWSGLQGSVISIAIAEIAKSTGLYLACRSWRAFLPAMFWFVPRGEEWYRNWFVPCASPLTLIALLFAIWGSFHPRATWSHGFRLTWFASRFLWSSLSSSCPL